MEKKIIEKIARELCSDLDAVYLSCPSIYSEELLFSFRNSDANRNPTVQDSVDLQHQIPAFGYCDYVVTNDAFFFDGGKYAQRTFDKRVKNRKFEIARKLSEIAALV